MSLPLSIIVCTHRRFKLLALALESLCRQSAGKETFEVIVVDNDVKPNAEVQEMVNAFGTKIGITYVHDPVLGLSQARNAGGKVARAAYVAYMDDDAKASAEYVSKALEIIQVQKPDYFGGPYYPYYLTPKPAWFQDRYESSSTATETRFLKANEFLNGTNMIYKRELLELLGWFDTGFGMTGKQIAYGEETALQLKAWGQPLAPRVFYSSDLLMEHFVAPVKLKLSDRFKRRYNTGKSQAYLWIDDTQKRMVHKKAPVVILKTVFLFVRDSLKLFFRDRSRYPFWQNYAYEVLANYAASIGQEVMYLKRSSK